MRKAPSKEHYIAYRFQIGSLSKPTPRHVPPCAGRAKPPPVWEDAGEDSVTMVSSRRARTMSIRPFERAATPAPSTVRARSPHLAAWSWRTARSRPANRFRIQSDAATCDLDRAGGLRHRVRDRARKTIGPPSGAASAASWTRLGRAVPGCAGSRAADPAQDGAAAREVPVDVDDQDAVERTAGGRQHLPCHASGLLDRQCGSVEPVPLAGCAGDRPLRSSRAAHDDRHAVIWTRRHGSYRLQPLRPLNDGLGLKAVASRPARSRRRRSGRPPGSTGLATRSCDDPVPNGRSSSPQAHPTPG